MICGFMTIMVGAGGDRERMTGRSALGRLLRRVGVRLGAVRLAWWAYRGFLALAGLYALALLAARLLGFYPTIFTPLSLLVVPAGALLVALASYRRTKPTDCARAIDHAQKTQDLFLTAVLLDGDSPEFSELVETGVSKHIDTVKPRHVVRWSGHEHLLRCISISLLLIVAVRWLPQFDPFGKEARREQQELRREELAETKRATAIRKTLLARHTTPYERSEEAELHLASLKKTLAALKPGEPKRNVKALTEQQQALGKSWQRAKHATTLLGDLPSLEQAFGVESLRTEQWRQKLAQGSTEGLKKELQELGDLAKRLQAMPDGAERRALEREMSQRLQEMSRFANDKMGSPGLSAALKRALAQMKMGGATELSSEALKALGESLDLADMELSQLQQAMNDLEALEEALRTLQLAQRCNQQKPLDGSSCTNGASLAGYAAMYEQMLAQTGCGTCAGCQSGQGCQRGGSGAGMKGPGQGEGGQAPEDESLATDYTSEKSHSAMRAGKMLMQWKTDESADKGQVALNYDRQIRDLREGINEAVLSERIPPAYHDTIRRYFDSLDTPAAPGQPPAAVSPDRAGGAE
jgi:hypothetical protein